VVTGNLSTHAAKCAQCVALWQCDVLGTVIIAALLAIIMYMVSAIDHARGSQMLAPIITKFQVVFNCSSRSPFAPVYGCVQKSRPHATIETSALLWAR